MERIVASEFASSRWEADWDEADEWNSLALQAVTYLRQGAGAPGLGATRELARKDLKAETFLEAAESSSSAVIREKAGWDEPCHVMPRHAGRPLLSEAKVLRRRLHGERGRPSSAAQQLKGGCCSGTAEPTGGPCN